VNGRKLRFLPAGAAACLLAVPAAAVELDADAAAFAGGESLVPSLVRLVLAMIAVLVLFYLCFLVFRWLYRRRGLGGAQTLRILEVLPLGTKAKLVAVKLGDKVLLVGAGENSLSKIDELPFETYESLSGRTGKPAVPFKDRLMALARK
jgi:flagellar biogenesis protein FliO